MSFSHPDVPLSRATGSRSRGRIRAALVHAVAIALAATAVVVGPAALQLSGATAAADTVVSSTPLCGSGGSFTASYANGAVPGESVKWLAAVWVPRGGTLAVSASGWVTGASWPSQWTTNTYLEWDFTTADGAT